MNRFATILLLLVVLVGCGARSAPEPAGPPSILLLTVDALRADHVGWSGHPRPTTPFLDTVLGDATVFTDASSVSSWTVPALASLVSGVYPPSHGVVHGTGMDEHGRPAAQEALPEALVLLPEVLQRAGYRTYGIVANLHGHEDFGFGRGFDRYRCVGFSQALHVNEVLAQWRDEIAAAGEPVFVWLHYFDPHWPYHVRQPWAADFVGNEPEAALASIKQLIDRWPSMDREVGGGLGPTLESVRRLYDVEIAHTDHMIEAAYEALPEMAGWFTIFSADHGEEFLDHGELGHSMNLFGETVRIPLVIRSDTGVGQRRVEAPVSLLDLAPTILRAAGAEAPESWHGEALIDGARRIRTDLASDRRIVAFLDRGEDRRHRMSLVAGRYKLITGVGYESVWLYDLENDPFERQDIAPAEPAVVGELMLELQSRVATMARPVGEVPTVGLSSEQIQQLEAIGYLDGGE